MSELRVESVLWIFGIVLFGIAALFPQALIRFLGRGRVAPASAVFLSFRIIAALCAVGLIYRIVSLYRR
jgi:hypothetical protein